jgi:hypothetical protein
LLFILLIVRNLNGCRPGPVAKECPEPFAAAEKRVSEVDNRHEVWRDCFEFVSAFGAKIVKLFLD